jgi:hypothetical protein
MEARTLRRWTIVITRKAGVEQLASYVFHPMLAVEEGYLYPVLSEMIQGTPELEDKLRIVPVMVDVREMTEEEGDAFRKSLSQQEYGPDLPPESL